jgi:hypothetical protein
MAQKSVFISYRREGGSELARIIKESLEKRGFKVFLDIEDLLKGPFPPHIYENIEKSSDLIAVLTPGCLDRCWDEGDWVKKEIAHAIQIGKNIVPVMHRNFHWPSTLPPEIKTLPNYHGLSSDHEFFEASMDRLTNLLTGRSSNWPKRVGFGFSIFAALLLAFYFFLKPSADLCDQYLCIEIPEKSVGTLLAEVPYDLKINLKNRTSTEMFVSDVLVRKYNAEGANRMGLSDELVHVGKVHGPLLIEPHENKTISVVGNEILPTRAEVTILHSLSGKASEFTLDLPHELQEMPAFRILPKEAIYTGFDGVAAIQRALPDAKGWSLDAHVIAAFPAESRVFLEPHSRLKTLEVASWVVTLFSPVKNLYYTAIVNSESIIEKQVYVGELRSKNDDRNPTPIPVIGNQKALELVSREALICGNWKSLRLSTVQINQKWSLAWFLPYRGSDSLPLIVDAVTGDLLMMGSKSEKFKKVRSLS